MVQRVRPDTRTTMTRRTLPTALLIAALAASSAPAATRPATTHAPLTAETSSTPRLLNGPVLFRLPRTNNDEDARRYAIAFRLDRDPVGQLDKTTSPDEGPFRQSRGAFSIGSADASIAVLRRSKTAARFCFVAYAQDVVPFENEGPVSELDRMRLGRKIAVDLQPAVPNGVAGGVTPGPKTYSRRPLLRRATSISLRSKNDERTLRSIHCSSR